MLFQTLSNYDKEMIQKWIDVYSGVENVVNSGDRAPLSTLLSYWNLEKKNLFKLLGNELIVSKTVDFKKPQVMLEEEMDYMIYCDDQGSSFRDRVNHLTYWDTNDEGLKSVHYDIMNLFAPSILAKNEYPYENFKIPTPDGKFIQVQKGCKPVKILGKLAAAYDIKGFEEFRLAHSQVLNQKSLKGDLCLSIHPMDYMTMSDNDCDWDSCMSWRNEGCYRRGTVEMMNSKYVVVAYLKAKEDMMWWRSWNGSNEEYSWNSKKWRELFIVDESFITGIKGYPYQNTQLEGIVIDWLAELAQKNLGWKYKEGIHQYEHCANFEVEGQTWRLSFSTDDMYNDFGTREHYARVIDSPVNEDYHCHVNYSGCHPCMYCGDLHGDYEDEGGLVCGDCYHYFYCECCDERIYNEEPYYLDGNRLCEYCYNDSAVECVITHENHYSSNMTLLYLSVEGVDKLDEYRDPSIHMYEHDMTDEDYARYFKVTNWHIDNRRLWNSLCYVTPEELTEEGFELFDFCGIDDVKEVAADREREREEARIRAEKEREEMAKRIAERAAKRLEEEKAARELNERLGEYTINFMVDQVSEDGGSSDSLTNVVRRFFCNPWS